MAGTLALGAFAIHDIEEMTNPEVDPFFLFPALTPEIVERHAGWLGPACWNPAARTFAITVRSWLVDTGTHRILIDTCCGNDKPRPYFPPADRLDAPYLERLAAAGCAPEDVDFVMCTHLHVDHCGWNTRLEGGRWVPTFPNARYLFSRVEYEHWARDDGGERPLVGRRDVFEDSVLPIVEAGLARLVEGAFSPVAGISIEPAPGHSPGHCLIRAASRGTTGLFTGDALHHPIQVAEPEINSAFCSDPAEAVRTRRRILGECASEGHLLIPAHFPTPAFGRVERRGERFAFRAGA